MLVNTDLQYQLWPQIVTFYGDNTAYLTRPLSRHLPFCQCFLLLWILFIIFGCAGSSLLRELFSSCEWELLSSCSVTGFSRQWLFLLESTGSRALGLRLLRNVSSVVVAARLSCSTTCGIFQDLGSNPCPLYWQVESLPLSHEESSYSYE